MPRENVPLGVQRNRSTATRSRIRDQFGIRPIIRNYCNYVNFQGLHVRWRAISRIVACVLTDLCRRTLTAARLDALPPAVRRRPELSALRYAVAIADGEAGAPARARHLGAPALHCR